MVEQTVVMNVLFEVVAPPIWDDAPIQDMVDRRGTRLGQRDPEIPPQQRLQGRHARAGQERAHDGRKDDERHDFGLRQLEVAPPEGWGRNAQI